MDVPTAVQGIHLPPQEAADPTHHLAILDTIVIIPAQRICYVRGSE